MKISKEELECNLTVGTSSSRSHFQVQEQFPYFSLLKELLYYKIQLDSSVLKSEKNTASLVKWGTVFEEGAQHYESQCANSCG